MTPSEFRERLLTLARPLGIELPAGTIDLLGSYLDLLTRWNERINLTSLPLAPPSDEGLRRLIVEPLAAAVHIPNASRQWFDIGSGGGSPAIPLKIARPLLELHMVESVAKKAAFLRETARVLGLAHTTVIGERLEDLVGRPEVQHVAELITMRAVKTTDQVLRACHELIADGGELLLFCTAEPERVAPWFSHKSTAVLADSSDVRLVRYMPVFHVEQTS